MQRRSIVVATLVFVLSVVVLVAALVVSLIPFATDGSAGPTSAFRAQQELDAVAFELGGSPGARYSGTLTTTGAGGPPRKVEFTDLTVASTKNAEGDITYDTSTAQYRQIGNYRYLKGPAQLWTDLFDGAPILRQLDLKVTENRWTNLRYSGLPDLGYLLSPALLAGRIGNAERIRAPSAGPELPAPNQGLPDARFWPTSDPEITAIDDDTIRVGTLATTFDPQTKQVTHIEGEFASSGTQVDIDADVTLLGADDLTAMFTDERSLLPDLTSVPAPAVPLASDAVTARGVGACTPASCPFLITATGTLDAEVAEDMRGVTGHVNYGLTTTFTVDDAAPGAVGGTCTRVVSAPFGGRTQTTCAATRLPAGTRVVRPNTAIEYLPFIDTTEADLASYLDSQEQSSELPITMERTGAKKGDAARYNDQVVGFPSSYVVRQGDYLFDGVGPEGNLIVSFAPGYAEHVTAGRFDPAWPGTALLTEQLTKQVAAAGDRDVTYVAAEPATAAALRALVVAEGIAPGKVGVFATPLTAD
ncbi:hypothetical protein [Gordonia rhizosphera]|uniref:hypothetical protein n=1 Tax=Gordonia rhizosphera TaxID=83341 RepID=UPI000310B855|nr:hypothetical protein [Gordonia rhizosphera]